MQFLFLITIIFILLIIALGVFVELMLIGSLELKKENPHKVRLSVQDGPLYFALGATIYTFFGYILSITGIKLSVHYFIFLLIVIILINLFLYRANFSYGTSLNKCSADIHKSDRGNSLLFIAIFLIGCLILTKIFYLIAFPSYDIDLLNHFLIKAKILLNSTYKDSMFFHDKLFSNINPNYPPMFGILYNLLFLLVGDVFISYFYVVNFFIIFCIGLTIFEFLYRRIPKWQAVIWFFISISPANYLKHSFIINRADVMLSFFFLVSACQLCKFFEKGKLYHLYTSVIIASGAALLKNEGLIFILLIYGTILFYLWKGRSFKKSHFKGISIGLVFAISFLLLFPWWLFQLSMEFPFNPILLNSINDALPFFGAVLKGYVMALLSWQWHGVFLLWVTFFIIFWKHWGKNEQILSVLSIGQLFIYFIIYYIGQGKEIGTTPWGVDVIMRTLSHCYPLIVIVIGLTINNLISESQQKQTKKPELLKLKGDVRTIL